MSKITLIKIVNSSAGCYSAEEITKHETTVYRMGRIKHQLYNGLKKEPFIDREYKVNKEECDKFFKYLVFVEDWEADYSVEVCDGYYWNCFIRHSDKSIKKVKGTVEEPPKGEKIAARIKNLANFKEEPWIF